MTLHRVANALLSNALNGWAGAAVNKRMGRYRLKRFTARWLAAALSNAFNGWADAAANKRSARYRFKKVTARWRRLQLSMPFTRWVGCIGEMQRYRTKLQGAIHRMRKVRVAAVFAGWSRRMALVRSKRAAVVRAERFVLRALHRCLADSCLGWRLAAAERVALRHGLRRVALRWNILKVRAAFARWLAWLDRHQYLQVGLYR